MRIFLKTLGVLLLGALVLVTILPAILSGLLMRVRFGRIARVLAIIGLTALVGHEISELFGIDRRTVKARLMKMMKGEIETPVGPGMTTDFEGAMKSLGIKSADVLWSKVYHKAPLEEQVKQALQDKVIKWEDAELTMIPSSTVKVTGNEAKQVLSLVESLEEHDDVQQVYANFDIPDDLIKE